MYERIYNIRSLIRLEDVWFYTSYKPLHSLYLCSVLHKVDQEIDGKMKWGRMEE